MREISNRIATSGNSKQERDKKGCGRDGRDRRNPIARITDKYERLERSSGSHPPSTISPLSLHSILGYVISCRNSFFFWRGEIIENAWTHFLVDRFYSNGIVCIHTSQEITRHIFIKHVLSNYYTFTDSEKF